jgi:SAM-dependent methyltransferase
MLLDTQRAFDGVAADYDGPSGNNEIVQYMRERLQRIVLANAPVGGRLLDLGCGTGLDAAFFAERGYHVLGIDSSPLMVGRSANRVREAGLSGRAHFRNLGFPELATLRPLLFDLIYSNLGPINCAPNLPLLLRDCSALLRPGGCLIVSVIGRLCPWEIAYYAGQGNLARTTFRRQLGFVPVHLGDGVVWTRYYSPAELASAARGEFTVRSYRSLGLLVPPPYLLGFYRRIGPLRAVLTWLEDRVGGWPVGRDLGDHFLMVLDRRDRSGHDQ